VAGGGAWEVAGEVRGGVFTSGAGWTGAGETEKAGLTAEGAGAVREVSAVWVWAAGSEAALRIRQSRQT
jgi:hypothetical protein